MLDQTIEFADRTWKRSGGVWVAAWQPPQDLNLHFEPSLRIVGRSEFDGFGGESVEPATVTAEQKAAAAYFFEHQSQVLNEVLRQLMRYCRRIHSEDPDFFDELANIESIDQLAPQIDQLQVAVEHYSADGFAWMSLTGGCDWEMEHLWRVFRGHLSFWERSESQLRERVIRVDVKLLNLRRPPPAAETATSPAAQERWLHCADP